jgi:hypothetical protein
MVMIARILGVSLLTSSLVLLVLGLVVVLRKLMIVRILGVSLLTGVMVVILLLALLKPDTHGWDIVAVFFLGTVAAVVGAIAGAAREIVNAQRQKPSVWGDTE